MLSIRGSKPMFSQTLKTSHPFSSPAAPGPVRATVRRVPRQLAVCGPRPDRNPANRIAVADRQFAQERGHLGVGERREARKRHYTDVSPADARFEAGDEVLIAEDRVQ